MLDTPDDFNDIIIYFQYKTFAEKYNNPAKKLNFQRRCKNFVYNQQSSYLFFKQSSKDNNSLLTKKRVVLIYITKLREALLKKFHVGDAHFEQRKKRNYSKLVNIFKNFGPSTKLQADNESEFITSILKNTLFGVQDYHWIDVLLQFVIGYNKAYEAYKKLLYEAFFGFKMHAVYNIPEEIIPKNVVPEDITPDDMSPEDIALEDIIAMKDIAKEIIPVATQNNYNQALY
ncbi:hypothetical protein F8M41_001571 [Gigaspora margarita]|uniref:Uncharacterized protein n=1 Tax=Gigaspora margarita TaxID=4874 RepID=A0A8H4A8Y8_GIGMA|nr:hypothetical protein F8M41_001571 [Gigaspora margarita]